MARRTAARPLSTRVPGDHRHRACGLVDHDPDQAAQLVAIELVARAGAAAGRDAVPRA